MTMNDSDLGTWILKAGSLPPVELVKDLGDGRNLLQVVQTIGRADLPSERLAAIWRELLIAFPTHDHWPLLDEAGGPSIETVLLTVWELRWDLREDEVERLQSALQRRPGYESLEILRGLSLGARKPVTLGTGGFSEVIRDSDLTGWLPRIIDLGSIRFANCRGVLELGNAMEGNHPERGDGTKILELRPDLDVVRSRGSLAGRKVTRVFESGWEATYFLKQNGEGWLRGQLDSQSVDLTMPIEYSRLDGSVQVESLPLGCVNEFNFGRLEDLPRNWTVPGRLGLFWIDGLRSLPAGLELRVRPLTERCDREWSRFPEQGLAIVHCKDFTALPEDLSVPVGLSLEGLPNLHHIPDSLMCQGILSIRQCPIDRLPATLQQLEELHLVDLPCVQLPPGLRIKGNLTLEDLPNLTELPSDLQVGGCCELRNVGIVTLPTLIAASEGIWIRECQRFVGFRPGTKVLGGLCLVNCPEFRNLPENMQVNGRLNIWECPNCDWVPAQSLAMGTHLKSLPRLSRLPEGFTSQGDLRLENLPGMTILPLGMKVVGGLNIEALPLRTFPDDLILEGGLRLACLNQFSRWPLHLCRIQGDLWLENLPLLGSLPDGLHVGGKLTIRNCPSLRALPKDLQACVVECSTGLVETMNPRPDRWIPEADEDQMRNQAISEDPFLQVLQDSKIQSGLSNLALMALHPEFMLRGRWLQNGRLEIFLQDFSGLAHEDAVIGDFASSVFGYQCLHRDFRLSPEALEMVRWASLRQLVDWGFGNHGGMFTYETHPERLQDAMAPYFGMEPQADSGFQVRPHHIHMVFFRREFLGGGHVSPLNAAQVVVPVPPFSIIQPAEYTQHTSLTQVSQTS